MYRSECHVTEIVGISDESVEAAIRDGMCRATGSGAPSSLEWFEVTGVRSHVLGRVHRFRVDLRLGLHSAA